MQARFDEAIAERERALALDPANAGAMRGWAGITFSSVNSKRASRFLTRRFDLARAIRSCYFVYTANRGPILG